MLARGDIGSPGNGGPAKIVGFSKTVKGDITDEQGAQSKYVVFVEQSGDYRMGRVQINGWRTQ